MTHGTPDLLGDLLSKRRVMKGSPLEAWAAEVRELMSKRDAAGKKAEALTPQMTRLWSEFLEIDVELISALLSLAGAWMAAHGCMVQEVEWREAQMQQIRDALATSTDRSELQAMIKAMLAEQWKPTAAE